jgi:Chitobiase/beta-hexosaminidase C-terminal domain
MMKRLCPLLVCIMAFCGAAKAHAATCATLSAGASQSTIQSALNSCGSGNTVAFSAGLYSTSSSLTIPCGVSVTGPAVWPNTAILSTSAPTQNIFSYASGGCTAAMSLQWIQGNNAGLLYTPGNTGTYSNMTIEHNTSTNLPSYQTPGCPNSCGSNPYFLSGSTFFNGTQSSILSNITIEFNQFGDSNSCSAIIAQNVDYQGLCAAVFINLGQTTNITFRYNRIFHLEEGFKMTQVGFSVGAPIAQSKNLDVEFNYFLNIHRIEIEIQQGVIGTQDTVNNNVFQDQINPFYGSLGISTPCCQFMNTDGTATSVNPAITDSNNVKVETLTNSTTGCGEVFGYEFWGQGTQGNNNLMQGNAIGFCPGFTGGGFLWGYGAGSWQINNNIIQGAFMASNQSVCSGTANPYTGPGYILSEECQGNPPTQTGNVLSATPTAITSVAPAISPGSGSFSGPHVVTMTDAGLTSGAGPLGNTSIYYTTDGSTPVPGSGTTQLYTGAITLTSTTTVKAVGFYGAGYTPGAGPVPYPYSYPSGYGYLPSAVVSATYTSSGGVTLSSVALSNVGSVHSITGGSTIQMTATCTYSNGSTTACNTTDAFGNAVSSWNSSNAAVSISASGLATGVSIGSANLTATVAGLTTPNWAMAVTSNPISLSSVSLATTGGVSTLAPGGVNQLLATCTYSDSSTTSCGTTDSHGNVVNLWTTTAPSVATVNSSGVVTGAAAGGTSLTATVGAPIAAALGNATFNTTFANNPNFINATYAVPPAGGGTVNSCSLYIPATAQTSEAFADCGLLLAPTPTTSGTSWLCHATYTYSGTTGPGTFVSLPLSGCGTITSPVWVASDTNAATSSLGYWNCGGSCGLTVPTSGTGAYTAFFKAANYGTYTGLSSAMTAGGSVQLSAYVNFTPAGGATSNAVALTVTAAPPTLMSAYLTTPGNVNTLTVGATLQFAARCVYSDSSTTDCTVADIHGNAVTVWTTSDATKATIGAVGSANP